jgi:hypothetical protein
MAPRPLIHDLCLTSPTMAASNTALFMADIILEIFQYIDMHKTIAPALVNSTWSPLFLDKIWRKLTTLDGVFRILTQQAHGHPNVS